MTAKKIGAYACAGLFVTAICCSDPAKYSTGELPQVRGIRTGEENIMDGREGKENNDREPEKKESKERPDIERDDQPTNKVRKNSDKNDDAKPRSFKFEILMTPAN